jgi:spore coat protein U-like protein
MPALAETRSATMSVSAVVENNCIVATTPMAFSSGSITSSASVESTARISVACSTPTAFTVDMDRGVNSAGNQRRMVSENGDYLDYQIYSDAALTKEWGAINQGLSGDSRDGGRKDLIAYGRINAVNLTTPSGGYRDTITVSVNF